MPNHFKISFKMCVFYYNCFVFNYLTDFVNSVCSLNHYFQRLISNICQKYLKYQYDTKTLSYSQTHDGISVFVVVVLLLFCLGGVCCCCCCFFSVIKLQFNVFK